MKTFKVLLVEDNPHVREMLAYGVQKSKDKIISDRDGELEVETAADGALALEMLMKNKYDLLIADLYMPVLDGKQLIKKIREDSPNKGIKILAISASSVSAHEESIMAGADLFLRKPVRLSDLVESIAQLI